MYVCMYLFVCLFIYYSCMLYYIMLLYVICVLLNLCFIKSCLVGVKLCTQATVVTTNAVTRRDFTSTPSMCCALPKCWLYFV